MSPQQNSRPPLLDFDQARQQLLANARSPAVIEQIPLLQALGRVVAEPVVSPMDVPAFANSAMDGYAICVDPTFQYPIKLEVTQRIAAGASGCALTLGQAARIFTGAPVPPGTYAVVPQENVDAHENHISITQPIRAADHVREQGEDIAKGHEIISVGTKLRPADLALAASVGVTHISTFKALTVAILLTGDELVEPGAPLGPGQIYNSNRYWLQSMLTQIGCQVIDPGIVRDTAQETKEALLQASEKADVIITCGGVSVGEEDHVRAAVASMGHIDLWQIAMKPGKPLAYGKANGVDFIGLPGNPVSAYVTFILLALPFLQIRMGLSVRDLAARPMVAGFDWPKPDRRREFIRVKQQIDSAGNLTLSKWPNQSSGVMSSVAWADGLVDIRAQTTIKAGDIVQYLPLVDLLDGVR